MNNEKLSTCIVHGCIGLMSERRSKWFEHGIDTNQPKYYNAIRTIPYWKCNETIRFKLDIERGEINRVEKWYFMTTGLFGRLRNIKCK